MNIFHQATQTLLSHLRAQGFSADAQGSTVTIDNAGRQQKVEIGEAYGERQIAANDLRSAHPEHIRRALEAVKRITGLKLDVKGSYRKVETKRAGLDANFEDILFRSKILSRCPNPTAAEIATWRPVVRLAARKVFFRFKTPLLAFGYEADDMESLGLVHLTTALHRYRSGDGERDKAVIGRYLTQRLTEVVRKVQRKGRRCTASSDVRSFMEIC